MKVDLYIRVSTDKQAREGDSLEEQESELRKFCDYRGFQIHHVFIERGKSGGSTNRPEYKKLVKDIKEKKIDAVVVKKLDRLSRSLMDFEQLTVLLQEKEVEFISLKENFDTTNALGKAMLRVALVFAQLEREQTAERIMDVFTYRAEQGLYNGGIRPFGYDTINKELVPHKQERKVIEFMFQSFLKTKSTTAVARECNSMGFCNRKGAIWDKRQVHKILKRPVYMGQVHWNGIISEGVHQPIVSQETYEKAQDIFNQKNYSRRGNKIKGLLKGLLFYQDENTPMTPNYTKKKNKIYYYYRCVSSLNPNAEKTPKKCLPMEQVNEAFLKKLLSYATEKKLQIISNKVKKRNDSIQIELDSLTAEIEGLRAKLKTVSNKKEKYLDSLISNQFTGTERQIINEKINEFSISEKQLRGKVYKLESSLSDKQDTIITLEEYKNEIVWLKINFESAKRSEIETWIHRNISKIICNGKSFKVLFKLVDVWVG